MHRELRVQRDAEDLEVAEEEEQGEVDERTPANDDERSKHLYAQQLAAATVHDPLVVLHAPACIYVLRSSN